MPLPPTPYPVCLVEFEGQAVPPDAVRSLTLETNVGYLADALALVLDNAKSYSEFIRKEQPVEVWLGYVADPLAWHKSELSHVFSGAVDEVLPTWGADTTLAINARDHTRLLIDEQADPSWAWANLTDAEVVADLAQRAGLAADIAPAGTQLSEQEQLSLPGYDSYGIAVVAPSGWDVIQQLAVRNGYVAYVTVDKRLYFGPRGGGLGKLPLLGGVLATAAAQASIGTWTYFEPPHDLLAVQCNDSALVVNKVTVVRWQPLAPGAPGELIGASAVDAGRLAAARGRVVEKTVVSTTANSEPDCKAEATARLAELARPAITATGTVEGDPRLVGDARITLAGTKLGRFRGDYYVVAARHRFGTDGYTTDLTLSSVRPEASEVYRPTLGGAELTPEQATALQQATVPTCGDAPVDWAADWPEFGGGVEGLLVAAGLYAPGTDPKALAAAAHATCGPIAAAGLLKAYGIATDPGKLAARAYQGDSDGKWWTGGGMAGPDSEVKLLNASGVAARNLGLDIAEAVKRCSACQPVIFDLAGGADVGHYVLASAYRATDRRFFGGVTISNAMVRSGHNPWATVAEIESYGLGSIRSVIVADVAMQAGANQAVTGGPSVAAAYPLTSVPAGLLGSAPARLQAAITKRWPRGEWDNAAAISFNETGGGWNETAHKDDAIEDSRGVFQVNVRPNANPQFVAWDLFDYDRCAEAAYRIWVGAGNSWRPWSTARGLRLA